MKVDFNLSENGLENRFRGRQKFQFDGKIIKRNRFSRSGQKGGFDPILLSCHDYIRIAFARLAENDVHIIRGIGVMIFKKKSSGQEDAEGLETAEECSWVADAAKDKGLFSSQLLDRNCTAVESAGLMLFMDGVKDFKVRLESAEGLFNVGNLFFRRQVKPRNDDNVRAADGMNRLPQQTGREEFAISKGTRGIHREDVEVSAKPAMLEAVVEQENIGMVLFDSLLGGLDPVGVDKHFRSTAGLCQQGWFVGESIRCGSISAGEDSAGAAFGTDLIGQPNDQRSFSSSAGGEIADADDGAGYGIRCQQSPVIEPVPNGDGPSVRPRGRSECRSEKGRSCSLDFTGNKLTKCRFVQTGSLKSTDYPLRIFRIMASAIC